MERQRRDSLARIPDLVRRSAPSPDAPATGLPPDLDRLIRDTERNRAGIYAHAEEVAARCDQLTDELADTDEVLVMSEDDLARAVDDLAQVVAAG